VRVLGIDPGTRVLGYGVIEQQGTQLKAISFGALEPGGQAPLEERLKVLFVGINEVIAQGKPDAVAVEGVFTHKSARSALILGHARGVALLCAALNHLPVFEYAPAEVKRAVGASGAADKEQVLRLVRGYLGLGEIKRADATDALALALCHLNRSRFLARLQSARSNES
jgi:crossover junction endodeoxyribonuclease RuvC